MEQQSFSENIQNVEKLLSEFLNKRDTHEVMQLIQTKVRLAEEQKKNAVWKNFNSQNKIEENLEQKMAEYRKILKNLLKSEGDYLSNLQEIVKKYVFPIRTGTIKMKTQTFLAIFSNIDILFGIHQELYNDIKELEKEYPNISFCSVFKRHVDSMQIYTQYVNNFSNSIYALEVERKRSKPFNQYLTQCELTSMSLENLLPMPLNRIPQYRSFLTMLFNLTSESDPEYSDMSLIVSQMTDLQETVNVSLTQSKNMGDIIDVEKRVIGRENVSLRDIHRKFVKEGQITLIDKEKKHKDAYFFLFNDIAVTTSIQAKNIYKFKSIFSLQYCKLLQDGASLIITSSESKESITIKPAIEERESWIKEISKVISDLNSTQVFEKSLESLMKKETDPSKQIPSIIEDLMKRIEDSIETPGIFRISGSKVTTTQIKNQINRGIPVDLSFLDDHVVASLVKQFFRCLPDSLIPASAYQRLVDCGRQENPIPALKELFKILPQTNYHLLKKLFALLHRISLKSDVNMMSASNLAIVIGPNLAREKTSDEDELSPLAEISFSSNCGPIVELMVTQFATLFPEKISFTAKPNSGSRRELSVSRSNSSKFEKRTSLIGGIRNSQIVQDSPKFEIGNRRILSNSNDQKSDSPIDSPNIVPSPTPSPSPSTPSPIQSPPQPSSPLPAPASKSLSLSKPPPPPRKKSSMEASNEAVKSNSLPPQTPPVNNEPAHEQPQQQSKPPHGALRNSKQEVSNDCASCANVIKGSGLKVLGKNWHLECFVCQTCKQPFEGGSFREYAGLPYCDADFEVLLKNTNCGGCSQPIGDDFIEVMAKLWHPHCFVCSVCNGPLSGGFIRRNNKPVCKDCKRPPQPKPV